MKNRNLLIAGNLVLLAVVTRLIPHYPNFTAVGAMALFSGAILKDKRWAFALPLLAYWLSDLVLNNVIYSSYMDGFAWFTPGVMYQMVPILLIVAYGAYGMKRIGVGQVALGGIVATVIFFLVSNYGVWASGTMYPASFSGLMASYLAGLEYALKGTLLSNLFYSAVLFGVYAWIARPKVQSVGV